VKRKEVTISEDDNPYANSGDAVTWEDK